MLAIWSADVAAAGVIMGSLLGYLPSLAAALGLVFYAIQIWESKSIQGAIARWSTRRKSRHIARLNKRVERAHRALKSAQEHLQQFEPPQGPSAE